MGKNYGQPKFPQKFEISWAQKINDFLVFWNSKPPLGIIASLSCNIVRYTKSNFSGTN